MKVWDGYLKLPKFFSVSTKEVEDLFDSLKLKKGSRVLDLGCGYGKLSHLMTAKGYDVHAVDSSQKIINSIKNANFKISKQDARNLNFKGGYFDLVFTDGMLEHLKINDVKKVIKEELRVSNKYIVNLMPSDILINSLLEKVQRVPKEYRKRDWVRLHRECSDKHKIKKVPLKRLVAIVVKK